EFGRHVLGRDVLRIHRRDVHRDAAREFRVAAFQRNQHADAAAVHVGAKHPGVVGAHQTAHLHVLADLRDQRLTGFLDTAATELGGLQGLGVLRAALERGLRHFIGERQEIFVLGDEIGFRVDLDQHAVAAVLGQRDAAFGGHAIGLLVGLGETLLAQPFDRRVDVAVVLGERFLALHHAGAGALAQFLDHRGGDIHVATSSAWARRRGRRKMNGDVARQARRPESPADERGATRIGIAETRQEVGACRVIAMPRASAACAYSASLLASAGAATSAEAAGFGAAFFAGARRADLRPSSSLATGLPSASSSTNSLSSPRAWIGAAALPSSTASAAARAYNCTARIASSLPGMAYSTSDGSYLLKATATTG